MISKTNTQKRARKPVRVALAAALATLSFGSVNAADAETFPALQANEGMLSSQFSEMPASWEMPAGFTPGAILPVAAFQDSPADSSSDPIPLLMLMLRMKKRKKVT